MGLDVDLISQFVKANKDSKQTKKESTFNGTVVKYGGDHYVQIDGSELLTPVSTTTNWKPGDRVTGMIKDHTATITGNMSSPSATNDEMVEVNKKIGEFDLVIAEKVSTKELEAELATINELVATKATIEQLKADKAEITELVATKASIEQLTADKAEITELIATKASIEQLTADKAEITELIAKKADIEYLESDFATIKQLEATNANVGNLTADVADINTLMFGSASGTTIQTSFSNAVVAQIGDAQITSAMIKDLTASKITSGTINTNLINIASEEGSMTIYDETIQIKDENEQVRVQIGKDASNDYSINIWDASGVLMFSEGGITDAAIKQAIIRNDMVSETANISASKLDISSLFEEINNDGTHTLNSTKIFLDEKNQTLDVAFKSMSDDLSSQGTAISVIQGQISSKIWKQDIDSVTGGLGTQYSQLEQNLEGFKTTVGDTYATKGELSDTNTSITQTKNQILSTVSDTYATKDALNAANTAINQTKDQIALTAESLSIAGRNLLVTKDALIDTYVIAEGTIIDCETNYKSATMAEYVRVESGATYVFSKDESASGYFFRWAWYDEDKTVIGRTANNETTFTWTAPANAAYVRISYPYVDDANAKFEKGTEATAYCPAIEDMNDVYATTEQLNAAIEVSAKGITSTVSATYVTNEKFNNLEIGATNLIQNSNFSNGTNLWEIVGVEASIEFDETHGTCLKIVSPEAGSSNYRIYPSTTENFIHSGGTYSLSFYAKADAETTMQHNVAGSNDANRNCSLTTSWQRFEHTYDASSGSITFWANEAGSTIYITKIKMENGDKVTDWSLAPGDIGYAADVSEAQSTANEAKNIADSGKEIAERAESEIIQLADSISTLVTDGNGTSLMTQTSTGWVFSTGALAESIKNNSDKLDELSDTVDGLDKILLNICSKTEYIALGTHTDDDGNEIPCIELGEADTQYKLRITNTRIMFMNGDTQLTYIDTDELWTENLRVDSEFRQGNFAWSVRSNGNYGLMWKGSE